MFLSRKPYCKCIHDDEAQDRIGYGKIKRVIIAPRIAGNEFIILNFPSVLIDFCLILIKNSKNII